MPSKWRLLRFVLTIVSTVVFFVAPQVVVIEREEAKQSTLKSESAAEDKLTAASDKWKSAKTEGEANGQAKGGG